MELRRFLLISQGETGRDTVVHTASPAEAGYCRHQGSQLASGRDRGRVPQRQDEVFTEAGMHLLGRVLKKVEIFKIFEKSKNAGNCLKSAQNQKFLTILKKC
jgi:hypothetical protein